MHAVTQNPPSDVPPLPVVRLLTLFQRLDMEHMGELAQVYSDDVVFIDPFHEVHGRDALARYFSALYARLLYCRFEFHSVMVEDGRAMVRWTMTVSHPRLRSGAAITVPGVSELAFSDRVHFHRDFFDGAQLVYNHLPVLGRALSWVRKQM